MAASEPGLETVPDVKRWKWRGRRQPGANTSDPVPNAQAAAKTPTAGQGVIEVLVKPWGTVFVDGVKQGNTPATRTMTVSAGRHTITVRHPTLGEVVQKVLVHAGDHDVLRFDLNPRL
jgi:hypothetical protein